MRGGGGRPSRRGRPRVGRAAHGGVGVVCHWGHRGRRMRAGWEMCLLKGLSSRYSCGAVHRPRPGRLTLLKNYFECQPPLNSYLWIRLMCRRSNRLPSRARPLQAPPPPADRTPPCLHPSLPSLRRPLPRTSTSPPRRSAPHSRKPPPSRGRVPRQGLSRHRCWKSNARHLRSRPPRRGRPPRHILTRRRRRLHHLPRNHLSRPPNRNPRRLRRWIIFARWPCRCRARRAIGSRAAWPGCGSRQPEGENTTGAGWGECHLK
jgi:hypothetical protein